MFFGSVLGKFAKLLLIRLSKKVKMFIILVTLLKLYLRGVEVRY